MQGTGQLEYSKKNVYTGRLYNDMPHGEGTEHWPDGAHFEGEYKDGEKNGRGYFKWADGSTYEGEFANGCIDGYGLYK